MPYFYIEPDPVLFDYKYIDEQQLMLIQNDQELVFELDFIPKNIGREDFIEAFLDIIYKYQMQAYANTLLYITLKECADFDNAVNHEHETYNSKKLAKQLAQLLLSIKETPEKQLLGLKLNTFKESIKLTDAKLIAWIGSLVTNSLEKGDFSYGQLGEGAWHLLEPGPGGLTFSQPLNYERIKLVANKTVRSPSLIVKKLTAQSLHRIWNFLDKETPLTTDPGIRYSDKQLNFLFELAELLGWLNNEAINSESKDYMYSLFINHIKA